ncbi:MAG: carbamoyltransferase, partial [Verrucomicrobiae bacterium]|nr:carbamoyltransferase [Verrucomicrobiae bacterium]
MNILGINAYHGDASAALVMDGELVAAVAEERFNRQKHWAGFPRRSIQYCLDASHLSLADIDYVAVSRKPWKNWNLKLWNALRHPKRSRERFSSARAIQTLERELRVFAPEHGLAPRTKIIQVEHHLSHAASAFYVSGFSDAAILSMDGFGDYSSTLLAEGLDVRLRELGRVTFPHSLGVVYTAISQYLGFPHYGDEGKVMALAAFGQPVHLDAFRGIVLDAPNQLFELDLNCFTHASEGVAMTWAGGSPEIGRLYSDALEKLLGPARRPGEKIDQRLRDVAASLQARVEEVILRVASGLATKTKARRLCVAGGVALNSVANRRLLLESGFDDIYVQAAAADDGTAIGAALYVCHEILRHPRGFVMEHANYGPEFSDKEIDQALAQAGLTPTIVERPEAEAAKAISEGKVVGWFQGRMEYGPRALGNRSILADPRQADMKQILNDRVKHRETFRPFAPSVLAEKTGAFFECSHASPFMLLVYRARADKASQIPSVLHTDGTGRLQTVTPTQNPRYYALIQEFEKLTGVPIVLNTSFNDTEPIVCTPS